MFEKIGFNVGSICKIRVTNEKKITSFPEAYKGGYKNSFTVAASEDIKNLRFTPSTCHFVEVHDPPFHTLNVKFRVPKDSFENALDLDELESARFIVEFTDMNGKRKLAGRPGEACVIYAELRDNGQNKRDSNHYNCVVKLKRQERVPTYQF